tara:strand:- start:313 stop:792 length:480 start_codon:yes stop_codon:yes gene_type:complete
MTKKQLASYIRKIVKEEVTLEMNKLLKEIFIDGKKKQISETKKQKPVSKKHYTKNKSLNDILNETVALSKKDSGDEEWPTMGGGTFDSSRATELMGYGEGFGVPASKEVQRQHLAAQTLKEKNVNPEQVGEEVVNALTKDYSAVMNAMNLKRSAPNGSK